MSVVTTIVTRCHIHKKRDGQALEDRLCPIATANFTVNLKLPEQPCQLSSHHHRSHQRLIVQIIVATPVRQVLLPSPVPPFERLIDIQQCQMISFCAREFQLSLICGLFTTGWGLKDVLHLKE